MKLSAPTKVVFLIAVALAVVSLLAQFGILGFLPAYWVAFAAFAVLAIACMLKGV